MEKFVLNKDAKSRSSMFGLTDERMDVISSIISDGVARIAVEKLKSDSEAAKIREIEVIEKIIAFCENESELALAMYMFGASCEKIGQVIEGLIATVKNNS